MTTKIKNRQRAQHVIQALDKSNIGTGNGYSFYIPPGGFLDDINVNVGTAFDSATTTTVTATDGTTTFINGVTVKSTGDVTVAVKRKYFPSGGTITVSLAETGTTATTGAAVLTARVLNTGRADEFQDG